MPWLEKLSMIAQVMLKALLFNFRFIPVYIIVLFVFKTQYERYVNLQSNIDSKYRKTLRQNIEESVLFGLIAGFLCSVVIVNMGITINVEVFESLFIIMLVLTFINLRYICISYAGGILAFFGLVFGIPGVDAASLLIIIAVLHLFEGALIFFLAGKGRDSVPIFIRYKDKIAGAFVTQKFWPAPVVFLTFLSQNSDNITTNLTGTGGWTFFNPEAVRMGALALGLDCAVAVLGYLDVAITRKPEKKSRETSALTFLYGTVLLSIALLSRSNVLLGVIGALFSILAHEAIVWYGRYRERKGEPIFLAVNRGLKVLEVLPDSHAFRMGMQRGDVILNINGRDIQTEAGMNDALKAFPTFIWVRVINFKGNERTYEYRCFPEGADQLGVLCVPRENEVTYNVDYFEKLSVLRNLVSRFRGM